MISALLEAWRRERAAAPVAWLGARCAARRLSTLLMGIVGARVGRSQGVCRGERAARAASSIQQAACTMQWPVHALAQATLGVCLT